MSEKTADPPRPERAPVYRRAGRPGVEQVDVDAAADALLKAGERPSVEKVRARTGGSPNKLGPLLDDWWRRLSARMKGGPEIVERLPPKLGMMAEALYQTALAEAQTATRNEESRSREGLSKKEAQLDARSIVLTKREGELQGLIASRDRRIQELYEERTQLLRDHEKDTVMRTEAERRAAEIEKDRARTLRDLEEQRTLRDRAEQRAERADHEKARLAAEVRRLTGMMLERRKTRVPVRPPVTRGGKRPRKKVRSAISRKKAARPKNAGQRNPQKRVVREQRLVARGKKRSRKAERLTKTGGKRHR